MKRSDTFLEAVSYWPLNIASGPEFLLVYLLIAVVALAVTRFVQAVVAGSLDGPLPDVRDPAQDYRAQYRPGSSIRIGSLPQGADIYRVAYLRGGANNVADTLLAQACAQGWLNGLEIVGPVAADASTEMHHLHAALSRFPSRDGALIRRVAKSLDPRWMEATRKALMEQNLLRPAGRRFMGALVVLVPMAMIVWLGVLRVMRGMMLDRPVSFLVLLMLAIAAVSIWLSIPGKKTVHAERYLAWLEGATSSFRAEAARGAAQSEPDWMLAAAVGGAAAVPFLALYGPPPASYVAGGVGAAVCSSSGSSCSGGGSSCGGGGGCGGGGCGG